MARQTTSFTITDGSNALLYERLRQYLRLVCEITGVYDFANAAFESLTLNPDGSITVNFSWLAREDIG